MTVDASAHTQPRSRAILLLLLLSLVLRMGWAISRPSDDTAIDALPDQREYLSIARNLLHGGGLQFIDARFNDAVKAFRTPGYPLLVASCGGNVRIVRIAQAMLDASTVLAVYLLSRRLIGGRIAPLIAAGIAAFDPYLIYFTGLLLSETLFTSMLTWGMLLLVWGNGAFRSTRAAWLAGGLPLAFSVLVRPAALALPVVLGLLSLFLNNDPAGSYKTPGQREPALRGAWPAPPGLTLILLTLLSLLPWAVRNRVALGHWIWLDTNSGFTLYDGYNADATGGSDQSFVDRMPELQALDEVGRDEHLQHEAIEYARTHPARLFWLAGAKLARTWSPVPLSHEYGRPALRLIAAAYSVPFDLLVLAGLLRGRLPRSAKLFLLAPALYLSIMHALTVGSLRYRVPAEPPLAVVIAGLAGGGGAKPWRRAQSA